MATKKVGLKAETIVPHPHETEKGSTDSLVVAELDIEHNAKREPQTTSPTDGSEPVNHQNSPSFSPFDPTNPLNFPTRTKILIGTFFSLGQLIPIMSASMIAPSLSHIAADLHISAATAQITMSSYFLGMAFAPLLIASLSEMYGRKKVWVCCNMVYVLGNAICPVGMEFGVMVVGRVVSGAGASVGVTLNGPVMADMYGASERGKSLAIITLLPYLGPALGPLVGGAVTQLVHWRWVFWSMSIVDFVILLLGLLVIRETYAPVLLQRKAQLEGNSDPRQPSHLRTTLLRPVHMLIHRPILWLTSFLSTLSFGVYCLMLSTYATLWIELYRQSELTSSLHYVAIALGSTVAGQVGSRVLDYTYKALSERDHDDGRPEYRVPILVPGIIMMPIGLCWYGWSAACALHWAIVDIGTVVFTLGSFICAQAVMAYQLDEFAEFSASANAASRVVSYVLAFVFPIFAPELYGRLGYGWGNSILGFAVLVLGGPCCWVLWKWGAQLRAVGKKI